MRHISDLFQKYRDTITPPQASVERVVREVIRAISNIELTEDMLTFSVKERVVYLTAPSVIKSEVLRRAPAILAQLQKELGVSRAPVRIV